MPNYKMPMKMYGAGKNPIMLTKEAQTKIMASDANPNFKAAISKAPVNKMYGKKAVTKMYGKHKK